MLEVAEIFRRHGAVFRARFAATLRPVHYKSFAGLKKSMFVVPNKLQLQLWSGGQ